MLLVVNREYVFTANEGDTKEEYKRFKTAGAFAMAVGGDVDFAAYKADEQLGRLDIDTLHGFAGGPAAYDRRLPFNAQTATRDKLIATGGRSFSILDASNGALVYDSGDAIESAIANDPVYSAIFNTDNDENSFRSRSPKKGPEPETIEVFQLRNKWFAAVGLERQSGMMLFDVTVPEQSTYVGYVTDRSVSALDSCWPPHVDMSVKDTSRPACCCCVKSSRALLLLYFLTT